MQNTKTPWSGALGSMDVSQLGNLGGTAPLVAAHPLPSSPSMNVEV